MIKAAFCTNKDIQDVWLVGDSEEDKNCAANAGINFIWANDWLKNWTKMLANS